MKNYYQEEKLINVSEVDVNYNFRLDNLLNCLQDVTTTHSYELKVDRDNIVKNSSAFWVLTKMKVVFNKLPKWNEKVTVKTYPTTISPIRFFREYSITSDSGVILNGKSEWCVLDVETKALRRSNSIDYPTQMEHLPPNPEMPDFTRLKEQVTDSDYVYTYKVMQTDIDCNEHTNNVVYAKMALNAFTLEEFKGLNFTGIEINFLNQSYYDNEVAIFKKKVDGGYYIEGKLQDKTIFTSKLYI